MDNRSGEDRPDSPAGPPADGRQDRPGSDSPGSDRSTVVRYGPARAGTAAAAAGAVALAGLAVGADDRPGRLLFALASAALALVALRGFVYFPTLTASATGLAVRSPGGSGAVPWPRVEGIRVEERARLGLVARSLEIDLGDELLVFGRYTLGADPRDVGAVLAALRPN